MLAIASCQSEPQLNKEELHDIAIQRTLDRLASTFDQTGDGAIRLEDGNLVIYKGKEEFMRIRHHPMKYQWNQEYSFQSIDGEIVSFKIKDDRSVDVTIPSNSNKDSSFTATALLDTLSLFSDDYFPYQDSLKMFCVKYLLEEDNVEGFIAIPQESQFDGVDTSLTDQMIYFLGRGPDIPMILRNQWVLKRIDRKE